MTPEQSAWFAETFSALTENVGRVLLGKESTVRLALTAMIAEGHLLLEDAPGTGKTSLAKALAATVQGTHHRIQFTPDLLPSDVTGVTIYDQGTGRFEFHRGPVFASVVPTWNDAVGAIGNGGVLSGRQFGYMALRHRPPSGLMPSP